MGLELRPDPTILAAMYKRFAARQMVMPPNNAKQAQVLSGAAVLENKNGSAPGQYLDTTVAGPDGEALRRIVILLPGPPKELKPLFDTEVKPRLAVGLPVRHLARRMLRMALIPESQVMRGRLRSIASIPMWRRRSWRIQGRFNCIFWR